MEGGVPHVAGYEVRRELGRGGMGVVYLARHLHLDRDVALKVLTADLADDATFRERFIRESRLAASLTHPNIISIYDAGDDDGRLFIAMRFIQGRDLRAHLRAEGPMGVRAALGVIRQVAAALDRAHQAGLVHRDVKPANVILAEGGPDEGACFLTDFGLSRHTTSKTLTSSGQIVGTLDYLSPEQIEGRPLDGRADVYSLGCVFFELLTGSSPFDADSDAAVLWGHMSKAPPSLPDILPGLPVGLDKPIAQALAKDPADRFTSCAEFVDQVEKAIGDSTTGMPTVGRAAPRRWRRQARDGGAGSQARGIGSERRKRSTHLIVVAGFLAVGLLVGGAVILLPRDDSGGEDSHERGILLGASGTVTTTVISTNRRAILESNYGMQSPEKVVVCRFCKKGDTMTLGRFEEGTELLFYMSDVDVTPDQAFEDVTGTCLSNDVRHAQVVQPSENRWEIGWDDLCGATGDGNYLDLVTEITLTRD